MLSLPTAQPIPLCEQPSVELFRQAFVDRGAPVVIRGALRQWPALRKWSPAWMGEQLRDVQISAYQIEKGEVVFAKRTGIVETKMRVAELVERLTRPEPTHRMRARIFDELPSLAKDIEVPAYCAGGTGLEANLWMAGPGTVTRLHFDQPHNLFAQVHGRKRVFLFSPDQRSLLYPGGLLPPAGQFSRAQWQAPDFEAFPKLAETRPLGFELEPGDLLFIPSGWWHYLDSDEATLSVNFWWWPWWRAPLIVGSNLYKAFRGVTR